MRQRVIPMPHRNPTYPSRQRLIAGMVTIAAAFALLSGSWATSQAQDGTGGAPPLEETNCVLVPASDIAELRDDPDATPAATPAASPVTDDAPVTPIANLIMGEARATPMASPVVNGTPGPSPVASPETERAQDVSEEQLTEDLVAASTSLTSCLSEGDFGQAADHMTSTFRGQLVGSTRPLSASDYVSLAETFPLIEYAVLEVENPSLVNDTTATADVVWSLANQVRSDHWTFTLTEVQGITMWTVDEAGPGTLTPSLESTSIFTTISGNRYSLLPISVADDTVLFEVNNNDAVDHELLVLRMSPLVTTDDLLRTPGPQLPNGVTMIGQATIMANSSGRLILTGLEPGVYTIVCLLPDENGVPHLADGMEATFTIEAP